MWSLLNLWGYICYKPKPVSVYPTYNASEDVTVVTATIDTDDSFKDAIATWRIGGGPKEIIVVTAEAVFDKLQRMARRIDPEKHFIRVIKAHRANKRVQLAAGIAQVKTPIFVTADDDVFWPAGLLPNLLACFEDPDIGGATVAGGVTPVAEFWTMWEILGDFRMASLAVTRCASSTVDGGITALSGRTSAYRTELFRGDGILNRFVNERWMGKYPVSSADGCALTEAIVCRGWKIYIQKCPETELVTTVKNDWTWLLQVVRWCRDHWRQNLKALFVCPRQSWKYPFTTVGRIREMLQPVSSIVKCILILNIFYYRQTRKVAHTFAYETLCLIACAMFSQIPQMLPLLPHLRKNPTHMLYLPCWAVFCYIRGFISLYALLTLHVTVWGTRRIIEHPVLSLAGKDMRSM